MSMFRSSGRRGLGGGTRKPFELMKFRSPAARNILVALPGFSGLYHYRCRSRSAYGRRTDDGGRGVGWVGRGEGGFRGHCRTVNASSAPCYHLRPLPKSVAADNFTTNLRPSYCTYTTTRLEVVYTRAGVSSPRRQRPPPSCAAQGQRIQN